MTRHVATMMGLYDDVMGAARILVAALWLWLIWMSVRSGVTWGWAGGPNRRQRPALFWLVMVAYLALAVAFAWHGLARL